MATNKYSTLDLGTIEAVFNKLGGIEGAQRFLRGEVGVVTNHVINLDAKPFVPNGWTVEEHIKGGQLAWDKAKVALHLEPEQQNSKVIVGNELRKRLENEPVLNANTLDYLLANPDLIPDEWKGRYIFFWGTIYRNSVGDLCVRGLFWRSGRWYWSSIWLGSAWLSDNPAAVLASI